MAKKSNIEWTEMTWNPVTGCTKISPGCKHCYAEVMSKRLRAMGADRYQNGFRVTLHEDVVDLPLTWKRSRIVFVNSMSDLFQERVPLTFIRRIFETMRNCPQHQFQVLTKRAERLAEVAGELEWSPNVWMGVSVENQDYAYRARLLRAVPASVRFISVEPLLGRIDRLPLSGIHWVIVGGESGPGARPMKSKWVESIYRQCRDKNVPFFFKQWGGVQKHRTGREPSAKFLMKCRAYNRLRCDKFTERYFRNLFRHSAHESDPAATEPGITDALGRAIHSFRWTFNSGRCRS